MPGKKNEKVVTLPAVEMKEGDMIGNISNDEIGGKNRDANSDLTIKFIITSFVYQ